MTDGQWENLVGRIKDAFHVEEEFDEPFENEPGHRAGVIFRGPAGTMKVERTVRPLVLGERGIVANRIGASAVIQKEYSDTETTSRVQLFRQEGEAWIPVDLEALG